MSLYSVALDNQVPETSKWYASRWNKRPLLATELLGLHLMCSPLFEAFFLATEVAHLIRLTVISHNRQLSKILERLPKHEMLENRLYKYKQRKQSKV